jgi:hypothetical protein
LRYSVREISDSSTEEMKLVLKPENIAQLVYFIRGEKVMLDADLARLYGVSTKALNQALRRNRERFPEDFVFQLTAEEFALLRSQTVTPNAEEPHPQRLRPNWSQFVTSSRKHRGARYRPYAFTEQGVAMKGAVVGEGDSYESALADARSAAAFHIESFGKDAFDDQDDVMETSITEASLTRDEIPGRRAES